MISFARSVVDTITSSFGGACVVERGQSPHTPRLYLESHYALALILLYLLDGHDDRRLQLAADRLNKWDQLGEPETFFNSFAILLSQILTVRYEIAHPELNVTLDRLCRAHKSTYREAWADCCGNNMYVQQVLADLLLYPLATGNAVGDAEVHPILLAFARFRSPEGLYFDGPRAGTSERLFPLTYCMKFLFLLGISYKLQGHENFRKAFVDGLRAALPLMTSEGGFFYFGRTDNSSFATGLTIFVLRRTAAGAEPARSSDKPAGDFRLRTGCLRWLLEKPRSAPGSASLLRARWLSILSMPPAPGSSCIGNCLLLQAHLVLEKTFS